VDVSVSAFSQLLSSVYFCQQTCSVLPGSIILAFAGYYYYWSWDSSVGIATGYELDDRGVGFRIPVAARIFSTSSRPVLGPTQPPIQWVPGALSPGVKRQGHEADHSPPTSAEVKKMWLYTAIPHTPSWHSA
jgi:hypothetical protein